MAKKCPFLSIYTHQGQDWVECLEEDCQLWNDNYKDCAFGALTGILEFLKEKYHRERY